MADLEEQGTALSGYEEKGPYHCEDCVHRMDPKSDLCIHPVVLADPALQSRLVQIDDKKGIRIDLEKGCCGYVNQSNHPAFLIMRHGETALNKENSFRSWINVPLDENGVMQAEAASEFLKDFPLKRIICSPLDRTVYTAKLVAEPHGLDVEPDASFLPWNLGELSGKPRKEYAKVLRKYIDDPDKQIPGGESLNDFKNRMFETFDRLRGSFDSDELFLIVAHTSNITSLQQWIDGDYEAQEEEDESVAPGGVLAVFADADNDEFEAEVIFGHPKKAEYGS